jgi:hypothetical protein
MAVVCALVLACARAAHGATITVPAGGNLQTAIDQAGNGDVILLTPGATYTGNFRLPDKPGITNPITIRSAAADGVLPGPGVRITPAYAPHLPKLQSPNSMSVLRTAAGAHHWTIQFVEFLPNYRGYGDIISLGAGDSTQASLDLVPHHLVLDRVYIHGDPVTGQKRGIGLHSRETTIVNSYIAECKLVGQDSQAIGGFNGPGNYVIENNYLEGAGENFLLGGADPVIPNLVTTNVVFRRNHLTKPLAWRNPVLATATGVAATAVPGAGSLPAGTYAYRVVARLMTAQGSMASSAESVEAVAALGTTGGITVSWTPVAHATEYLVYGRTPGGANQYWRTAMPSFTDTGTAGSSGTPPRASRWAVKNHFELKNAQDVLVEGNVMEYLWVGDQAGYPVVFTPRNQNGTAPWVVVRRVVFRHNLIRHTAGGINILAYDDVAPSQQTNDIRIEHNLFEDMTSSTWGSGSRFLQLGGGSNAITVNHNTVIGTTSSLVSLYGGATTNFVFTNNLARHNTYGFMGANSSPGLASINTFLPGSLITRNVLAGGDPSRYPAGNYFPSVAEFEAGFVNYAGGDFRLGPQSPFKGAGTDGRDLGTDVDAVMSHARAALSGANGTVRAPTPVEGLRIVSADLPDADAGSRRYSARLENEARRVTTLSMVRSTAAAAVAKLLASTAKASNSPSAVVA